MVYAIMNGLLCKGFGFIMRFNFSKLPQLGSLWMLVAATGFAIMGALVKFGAQKFTSAELVFYRSAFGLCFISLIIIKNRYSVKTLYLSKHLGRSLVGFVALLMFFYAIAHLPLATAVTLNYTSPLFLAALMPFMLKQEHAQSQSKTILYVALFIGFLGVIGVLHPVFKQQDIVAGAIGLLSGAGAGLAYIQVKQLGQLNEPDWRTVFYFTLVCTIGAGIWMLAHHFTTLAWQDLPMLLSLGASATIAQLALTRAYRTGSTLIVASLAYTTVAFASLLGIVFWGESLSVSEAFAIAMIALSGILGTLFSRK